MSDLGEKGATSGQLAEMDVTSDIESALNFLNSEEYQEDREPSPHSNPLPPGIGPVQSPQQKDSTTITTRPEKISRPQKIEKEPIKKPLAPLGGTKGKKSRKIWLLCLGAGILIFSAILILYKMGYPSAGA